jgi:hypothetical protein
MKSAKRDIRAAADQKRRKRRDELITIVNNGIRDVGKALIELRDDEHWRDTHNNFSDFCRDNFKISKTYLYDVIKGMEVIASLPKDVRSKITNEGQTRALAKLPESKRVEAILSAEKNGGITAESLLSHAAKPMAKPVPPKSAIADSTFIEKSESKPLSKKEPTLVDDVNTPIPLDAMPYAIRQKQVGKVLKIISDLRVEIKKNRDGGDYLWAKHGQDAYEYLSRAYSYISDASPDCVCLRCQGTFSLQEDGCSICGNTGMISQYRFDHFLPKEMREIRLLSNADYAKNHEITKTRPDPKNVC